MGWQAFATIALVVVTLAIYRRGGFASFGRSRITDGLVILAMAGALLALWLS